MGDTTKTYRRPDGSTYRQYGGPKSSQDVEVKEAAPAATPTPKPAAVRSTSSGQRTNTEVADRQKQEAAEEGVGRAETTEKVAPWLLEKPKQVEGGLGGASKRALGKVSAEAAGDALAKAEEEKKKKEKK